SPNQAQSVLLVGFSWARNRMCGLELDWRSGQDRFTVSDTEREFVYPWNQSIEALPPPSTPENMRILAGAQVPLLRSVEGSCGGGKLIIAELKRREMRIWQGA